MAADDLRREILRLQHRLDETVRSNRWRRDDFERAERADDLRGLYRYAALRLSERLARLATSSRPIMLGPWTGEVGFELLYWIPMLTWAVKRRRLPRERLIAVSRGGPALWYEHLTSNYQDVLDVVPPEVFRARARLKQTSWSAIDAQVLRHVRRGVGQRVDLLHPRLMYDLFIPLWRQGGSFADTKAFARFPQFTTPPPATWQRELPERYVAVKFYGSGQFPDSPENRQFADRMIQRLAEHTDVVVLTAGAQLDEHTDVQGSARSRVHGIDHLVTPSTNLDVQTRIIAHARAFVGSYGGFSYLAPFYGVPSVSFYTSRDAFFDHHLALARHVFGADGDGRFIALDVRDAALIDALWLGGPPSRA